MKFSTVACALAVLLLLPFASEAQSLGSVAKKEKERRDKNKKEGVAARQFSEEQVFGKEEKKESEDAEAAAPASDEEVPDAAEITRDPKKATSTTTDNAPDDVDPKIADRERYEQESRDRKRSEAEWRSRAASARARIATAQERVRYLDELFLTDGEYYVDENGNTVIRDLDHLRQLVRDAKQELAEAEQSWTAIQDDARRSGVPPGWLR